MPLNQEQLDYFSQLEQARGLPPGTLQGMAGIESNYGAARDRRGSQFQGMFQLGNAVRKQYGVTNPQDWRQSAAGAAGYAADNARVLQAHNLPVTPVSLYLLHQQGPGGGTALLSHPDAPAGSLINPAYITSNRGNPNAPAREFVNIWAQKYGGASPMMVASAPATNAPVAPPQSAPAQPAGLLGGNPQTQITANSPAQAAPAPRGITGQGVQKFGQALSDIAARSSQEDPLAAEYMRDFAQRAASQYAALGKGVLI